MRARARLSPKELVLAAAFPLGLGAIGWLVGAGAGLLLQRVGATTARATELGLWSFVLLGLAADVVLIHVLRRAKAPARADLLAGVVEVIEVATSRALNIGTAENPSYLIDLGGGEVLYLADRKDPGFPCTRFTLVRAPASGQVLALALAGAPLEVAGPSRPEGVRLAMLAWRESELLVGNI